MNASTILLVDDDEVLSQVLRRVLTRQGYNVLSANNVAQAEQMAEKHHPQLGLLDLCLPDGDGVELARRLNEKPEKLPLILLTAYPLRLRDRPDLAARFSRVLTKPVNLQELRDAIETALHEPKTTASAQVALPTDATAPPRQEPVLSAAAATAPMSEFASKTRAPRGRWYAAVGAAVAACVILLVLLTGWRFQWFSALPWGTANGADSRDAGNDPVSAVPGNRDAIALSQDVVERLKITTAEVQPATAHRPLELPGSLALDPDQQGRLRAPFAGEVVEIGTVREAGPGGKSVPRPLRVGDPVNPDTVIAVIWSADFGQKKSDLVDALSQLAADEAFLKKYEELYHNGGLVPEFSLVQQRRVTEQSRLNVQRAENSLRTAKLSDADIAALEKELLALGKPNDPKKADDPASREKFKDWAKLEIKPRFSGTIVERNVRPGDIVDTATDLFKVADLSRLMVVANVREEDLSVLQASPLPLPWTVKLATDPTGHALKGQGKIVRLSPTVDPTQHTALVFGYVDNPDQRLLGAQFVTATVQFKNPANTVAIPTAALVEDGDTSIVFVQPDPDKNEYVMKRVKVVKRYSDIVHISNDLTVAEARPVDQGGQGLQQLRPRLWWYPGERVVTQNALGMKAALDDLQSKKQP